jgi:hypothetical protein
LIASLHDDDWWAPNHLEVACKTLTEDPDCCACYSNVFETHAPDRPFEVSDKAWRVWLGNQGTWQKTILRLDPVAVMGSCLLYSPLHYSSLVGRLEPIRDAYAHVLDAGNCYDNDRLFPVFLSRHGSLGYNTLPDVFVRVHPGQDSLRRVYVENDAWITLYRDTSRWLLKTEPALVAAAVDRLNTALGRLDYRDWERVSNMTWGAHRSMLIEECRLNLLPSERPVAREPRRLRWLVRQLCPPAFLALKRRIAMRLHSRSFQPVSTK